MPGTVVEARDTDVCEISPCLQRAHSLAGMSESVITVQGTKQCDSCDRHSIRGAERKSILNHMGVWMGLGYSAHGDELFSLDREPVGDWHAHCHLSVLPTQLSMACLLNIPALSRGTILLFSIHCRHTVSHPLAWTS